MENFVWLCMMCLSTICGSVYSMCVCSLVNSRNGSPVLNQTGLCTLEMSCHSEERNEETAA